MIWNVCDPRIPSLQSIASPGLIASKATHSVFVSEAEAELGTLEYGQTVVLQHLKTGLLTRPFVICRIADRNWVEVSVQGMHLANFLTVDDSMGMVAASHVSQLHRIALMLSESHTFVSLDNDSITSLPSITQPKDKRYGPSNGLFELEEVSIWTLCSVAQTEYTFHVPPHLRHSVTGISPLICGTGFPHIESVSILSSTQLSLSGWNLTQRHSVFFGLFPAHSIERVSAENWIVELPLSTQTPIYSDESEERVPILIVRDDGIVYRSGHYCDLL